MFESLWINPPKSLGKILSGAQWSVPTAKKQLFITFDDGPIPEVSPQILDILDSYQAKATFFCVGENVKKYPEIYREILNRGHKTGNHTFNHLNGLQTPTDLYIENVAEASHYISSDLFRPPYGKLNLAQYANLKSNYRIVMWSILSRDYDPGITSEQCWEIVKKYAQPGSIVVFHDSLKAKKRVLDVLPRTLDFFSKQAYEFCTL